MGAKRRLALVVALAALIGVPPSLMVAQEQEVGEPIGSEPGVYLLEGGDAPAQVGEVLGSATLTFNHGAYLLEQEFPETVFAKVITGEFAFRVQGDVVVDPQDREIPILEASPEIEIGVPSETPHDFEQVGAIPTDTCAGLAPNAPVSTLCLLNPTIVDDALGGDSDQAAELFVALRPGDTVYIPAGTQCFFCNITGATGADPSDANTADRAQLLVWTSRGFSWAQMAQLPRSTTTRGWMRNPGSPCH